MVKYLKRGATSEAKADTDRKVRESVAIILADISERGDAAIRDLSIRFDGWDRQSYRLTAAEIQDCLDQLTGSIDRHMFVTQDNSRQGLDLDIAH